MMKQLTAFLLLLFGFTQAEPLLSQVFHDRVEFKLNGEKHTSYFPKQKINSVSDFTNNLNQFDKTENIAAFFYLTPKIIEIKDSFILGGIIDLIDKAYESDGKLEINKEITRIRSSSNFDYSKSDLEDILEKVGKGKQIFDELVAKENEIKARAAWKGKKLDDNEIVKQTLVEYGLNQLFNYSSPEAARRREYEKQIKEQQAQQKRSLQELISETRKEHEKRWKAEMSSRTLLAFEEIKTMDNSELWDIIYEGQLPSNFPFDFLYSKYIFSNSDTQRLFMDAACYEYLERAYKKAFQDARKINWNLIDNNKESLELVGFTSLSTYLFLNMDFLEMEIKSEYGKTLMQRSPEIYQSIKNMQISKIGKEYVVRPQDRDELVKLYEKVYSQLDLKKDNIIILLPGVKGTIKHYIKEGNEYPKEIKKIKSAKKIIEKYLSEFNSQ